MIKQIIGRTLDIITMPSGRRLNSSTLWFILNKEISKNIFLIKQYQMIQESRDKILVNIVEGRNFNPDIMLKIKRDIENLFNSMNEDVEVEVNLVEQIPKEISGKRRTVLSMTKRQQ